MAHLPCTAVICVLHGYTYGLGIDLCVCADIRLCASTTKFAVKEVDLGLAADVGTLSRLPRCVGSSSWVKDVCLTARTFDADEAHHVGFVSGVFESKDGAIEEGLRLAGLISSKSPVAVQGTKELLNHSRDHSVQDSTSGFSFDTGRRSAPQTYHPSKFSSSTRVPRHNPAISLSYSDRRLSRP